MATEANAKSLLEVPVWEKYADQFPVRQHLIYLNHGAVAPLCRPAADAMKRLADDCQEYGSLHYDQWMAAYEGVRVAAARLMGANRSEIALVKNTSEGIDGGDGAGLAARRPDGGLPREVSGQCISVEAVGKPGR